MRIDFGRSWEKGIKGKNIEEISKMEDSYPFLIEFQDELTNQLLSHFNSDKHNFNAKKMENGDIFVGGIWPFNCTLNVHTYCSVLGRDYFEKEIPRKNSFLQLILGEKKIKIDYQIPALRGHIFYQCDNLNPAEVLEILRGELGYGAAIYRDSPPSPSKSNCSSREGLTLMGTM